MQQISAKIRSEVGKGLSNLRKGGFLTAVLYGAKVESTPLSLSQKEFGKALASAGETSLVALKVEGGKTYNVLIHDVAKDSRTLEPIHADFYAVDMDRPIEAKIELVFIGESLAIKNDSGILVKVLHELEVKALPKDLPPELEVKLDFLAKIGDKIHVRDIKLPSGVTAEVSAEEVVALVEPPRAEAELEAAVKPEEAAPVEVKTEREIKAEAKEAKTEEQDAAE